LTFHCSEYLAGFFRIELGKNLIMIESNIAWATPGTFSVSNFPCGIEEDDNCLLHHEYADPSTDAKTAVERRLLGKI